MSFDHIRIETARDTVSQLNSCNSHLDDIDAAILQAISWGDLGAELADAHMFVGELIDEVPALSRMIEYKLEQMLATDGGFELYSMYSNWYSQAHNALVESLNDGFTAGPDAGGTYSQSYRGGFTIDGSHPLAGGRTLVENLLLTCGDGNLIAQDEFQIIKVEGSNSYIVVLPGVTDLSSPDLGLNDDHRSVRDLDTYAMSSAASAKIDDNRYAQMVRDALNRAGVPFGADIAIVGHSYGADTALDLAADDGFNGGARGYNVTHVVAAGYHSGPQLEHVGESTQVLVLQNHHDAAVIAEMAGHELNQAIQDAGDGDVVGAVWNSGQAVWEFKADKVDRAVDTGQFVAGSVVNFGSNLINTPAGWLGFGNKTGYVDWGDFDDILLIEDGVSHPSDQQTVVVFEGNFEGAGHHPNNYAGHVMSTDDESTLEFYTSLAEAGYTGRMERWSLDVSVPK